MPSLYNYPLKPVSWTDRDVLLFANTIGCTPDELHYLYELHPNFSAFQTYPIVLTFKHNYTGTAKFAEHFTKYLTPPEGFIKGFPELDIERVVDGERTLEVLTSIPSSSEGRSFFIQSAVVGVWDKGLGKATIVKTEHLLVERQNGSNRDFPFTKMSETAVFMGQGGWGGPNGPSPQPPPSPPSTTPTTRHIHHIPENAHLLYRLNGDYNPLHATAVPAAIVQPTPIMHGLYSWNVVAHAILKTFGARQVKSFRASFKAPVRPGDVLETEMWEQGNEIAFVTRVQGKVVLDKGQAVLDNKKQTGTGSQL